MTLTSPPTQPQLPETSPRFRNPWGITGKFDASVHARFQIDLFKEDYYWFKSICPVKGGMQTTVNILLLKLKNELIKRNITSVADLEQFQEFVAGCELQLSGLSRIPGSTSSRSLPETSPRNDGKRKTRVSRKNPPAPDKLCRVESGSECTGTGGDSAQK